MIAKLRNLWVGLVFGLIAYGCSPWAASAQEADSQPLQIHGMTLDETHLGDGFCEKGMAETVRPQCAQTRQLLPKVASIDVRTLPAPYVALTLAAEPEETPEVVQLWYAPRELGGQSFLITTTTFSPQSRWRAQCSGHILWCPDRRIHARRHGSQGHSCQ